MPLSLSVFCESEFACVSVFVTVTVSALIRDGVCSGRHDSCG